MAGVNSARSCREATAEGQQQLRLAAQPDAQAEQGRYQRRVPVEESDPGGRVRGHAQVGLAVETIGDVELTVVDGDGDFARFLAGEDEVIGHRHVSGLLSLEDDRQSLHETGDAPGAQALTYPP